MVNKAYIIIIRVSYAHMIVDDLFMFMNLQCCPAWQSASLFTVVMLYHRGVSMMEIKTVLLGHIEVLRT